MVRARGGGEAGREEGGREVDEGSSREFVVGVKNRGDEKAV